MYAYEIKFIAYNKEKTRKTLTIKALVLAPSPKKAKSEVEKTVKDSMGYLVDFKSIKNLSYKVILHTK